MNNRRNILISLVLLIALAVPVSIIETQDLSSRRIETLEFLSEEDLLQFAAIASLARERHSWDELLRSVHPALQSACTSAQFAAIGEIEAVRTGAAIEDRLLADVPGHEFFADPPSWSWQVVDIAIDDDDALVESTLVAFGQPLSPPTTQVERWVAVNGSWWLDVEGLAEVCASADTTGSVDEASQVSSFRRPAQPGDALLTSKGGSSLLLTLLEAERGSSTDLQTPPAAAGFENVFIQVRVETTDGSPLDAPFSFRAASFDGLYYDGHSRRGLRSCLGLRLEVVTCQVYEGFVEVAVDDPAPRLAWVIATPPPQERPEARLWWWLPTIDKDGTPVVTTVPAAESQSNLSASSIDAALWKTDFTRLTVDIVELLQAGVGRFGISAIAAPRTETIAEADLWLSPREPVQVVEFNGETRAYPIQLVIFHEIVNDYLGGEPVLVTYCPLCNTALSFERRVGIRVPVFDTTGVLRFSNLVMYDARTESWWQQVGGDAIVGEMAGAKLTSIPSRLTSWEEFKTSHPDGTVLSIETGFDRDYGINLYLNYDLGINRPNSVGGDEGGLSRFARVLGVSIGDEALALPFAVLEGEGVVESNVGGTDIVAFYKRGTVSALDSFLLAAGRDVGSAAAYLPVIDGTPLTFRAERGRFFDHETGSEWDLLGQSIAGPLVGETLTPVVQDNGFWFSWVAFNPDTEIYEAAPR